jgi:hypothetical protein
MIEWQEVLQHSHVELGNTNREPVVETVNDFDRNKPMQIPYQQTNYTEHDL